MTALGGREMIARELQDAVTRLHEDIARVEFWADALGGFAQPIPDYETAGSRLNEYILPQPTVKPASWRTPAARKSWFSKRAAYSGADSGPIRVRLCQSLIRSFSAP